MTRQPNILLLFSDEHTFRGLGCLSPQDGGEPGIVSPNLNRLAGHGTMFTNAYCQMALCTPSRLCLLTGREQQHASAWSNDWPLLPNQPTIASILGSDGYATCLVGKMHLGGRTQFAGFQHRPYGDLTGKTGHQWEPIPKPEVGMRARTATAVGVTAIPESLLQDEVVATESVAWIRNHAAAQPDQPWFLCAGFSRPHFPLTAPRRWIDRYPVHRVPPPRVPASGDAYDHLMSVGQRRGFQADAISEAERQRARGAYFACISYLDEVIGDLLVRLDRSGLLENTVIVYTTDHGELAGEHGVWWKNSWHEASARVPLIMSTPDQRAGRVPARRVETPVGLYDIFPTLCGLTGTALPSGLDGASLTSSLESGSEPPARMIVSDALVPRWGPGTEYRMVRRGRLKYIRFRHAEPLLFDVAADPGEQRNLLKRGIPPHQQAEADALRAFAESSMDFDAAEAQREGPDKAAAAALSWGDRQSTGNLYLFADDRLVNADDPLYRPTVISPAFSDRR